MTNTNAKILAIQEQIAGMQKQLESLQSQLSELMEPEPAPTETPEPPTKHPSAPKQFLIIQATVPTPANPSDEPAYTPSHSHKPSPKQSA